MEAALSQERMFKRMLLFSSLIDGVFLIWESLLFPVVLMCLLPGDVF